MASVLVVLGLIILKSITGGCCSHPNPHWGQRKVEVSAIKGTTGVNDQGRKNKLVERKGGIGCAGSFPFLNNFFGGHIL